MILHGIAALRFLHASYLENKMKKTYQKPKFVSRENISKVTAMATASDAINGSASSVVN